MVQSSRWGAGCPVLVVPNDVGVPPRRMRDHVDSLAGLWRAELHAIHARLSQNTAERAV